MKNFLLTFIIYLTFTSHVFALQIVYPKQNQCKISAKSTFFIGSINKKSSLKINGNDIWVSDKGTFAQIVPLEYGENIFKIEEISDKKNSSLDFFIYREKEPIITYDNALTEFAVPKNFIIINDQAPLRKTPFDYGINRFSHLAKGTSLLINGEKGDFYRVFLDKNLNAWINKKDVEQEKESFKRGYINDYKSFEDDKFQNYSFYTSTKLPFIVKEIPENLQLELFYLENSFKQCFSLPSKKLMGYEAYYEKGELINNFVLKIRKYDSKNVVIALDAGHGGNEKGAIGAFGDCEKDINLAIVKLLKKELELKNIKVVLTRNSDKQVSLSKRVDIAKSENANILISIHANALPDGQDPMKNRGTSVYYYHNQAKPLANYILDEMVTQLETNNDKVRQRSLALTRPTSAVSVLIEVGYIINPYDYELLLDQKFRKKCAKSIADGIQKYLDN